MKVYKFIYLIKYFSFKLKIFNEEFVDKYKSKCKIVYRNKIYPLQSEFFINDKISLHGLKNSKERYNILGIKLLSFVDISNINNITKGCKYFDSFLEENQKFKINIDTFYKLPQFLVYQTFKLVYKIDQKANKIKIFGNIFVKENKNKCFFKYKEKIFPLQEYFPVKNI